MRRLHAAVLRVNVARMSARHRSLCALSLVGLLAVSACGGGRGSPAHVDGGSDAGGETTACDRYLSCLLITTPTAYGAAIALYGQGSACWQTPAQASGCEQACDAAYTSISLGCTCEGATCTKCLAPNPLLSNAVYANSDPSQECDVFGPNVTITVVTDSSRNVAVHVSGTDDANFSYTITLSGTLDCNGSASVTGMRAVDNTCTAQYAGQLSLDSDGSFSSLSLDESVCNSCSTVFTK